MHACSHLCRCVAAPGTEGRRGRWRGLLHRVAGVRAVAGHAPQDADSRIGCPERRNGSEQGRWACRYGAHPAVSIRV